METYKKELAKVQRRDWKIRISVLAVLALLSTVVVVVSLFFSDLQELYEESMEAYLLNSLILGFVVLSFLFIGYMILKETAIKRLRKDMLEQKMASRGLERQLTVLQAVLDLTGPVNSEMVLSDVLDAISCKAIETLGGDQSSLFLYDPEIDKLRCVSVRGAKSDVVTNATVEVGKGIAGWVAKHGKPLYLEGDLSQTQFKQFVKKDKKISSSLCVPLKIKSQIRGVFNVTLFDKKRKFTESDVKLASIFAENAAVAIERAGLYEKLKEQTKTVKGIVNELKATKGLLVEQDTLRALGNLASGMSHDFNNILTAILSKTHLLSTDVREAAIPESTRQNLLKWSRRIEQLASQGAETARHVIKLTRRCEAGSEKQLGELDMNAIVLEAVGITKAKWKDEAELRGVRIEMQTELGQLSNPVGDRSEIREVLASMIYNSIDALTGGGKIKIATQMQDDDVEIRVIDDGTGMTEEIKNRVFEPFLTTKKEKGDGIGLSLALGIISRHNGDIKVESQPGKGTTFIITLPAPGAREKKAEKQGVVTSTAV